MPEKEKPMSYPKVLPTNDMSLEEEESGVGGGFPGKKISGSRRFSRVWKAVMFEPSVARKSKKGRSDKKPPKPLGIVSARYNFQERSNIEDDFDFDFGQRIISRSVSALATSSSAATAASNILHCPTCSSSLTAAKTASFGPISSGSKKTSTIATPIISDENNIVEQQSQKEYYRSCNRGLFFMLLSLLVLVFWGKICCIFWTSTWLFIVPRWMVKDGRIDSSSAMKPAEFKKKVVMEGLLARERGKVSS